MFKWLLLFLAFATSASAQNVTCATRPSGDSSNACASTAFVDDAVPPFPLSITLGGTGASTASGARTNLGLGTAATYNIGTSGSNVPLLSGTNIWSGSQTIPFTQSGAGAVASTVDAKLKQIVNVLDFGAVCDGSTNDATAFNAAVQAAGAQGVVNVPSGKTCYISGQTIALNLRGTEFNCNKSILKISGVRGITITGSYVSVHDCELDGQSATGIDGILISVDHTQIYRNVVYNFSIHGISLYGIANPALCTNNAVYENLVQSNGLPAAQGAGISSSACSYGFIYNNRALGNGAEGIVYDNGSYGYIAGNLIYGNLAGTGGLGVDKMTYSVVTGNIFQNNVQAGFSMNEQIGQSDHNSIMNNTFINNGGVGKASIWLHSCSGATPPCTGVAYTYYNIFVGNVTDGTGSAVIIDSGSTYNKFVANMWGGATWSNSGGVTNENINAF